MAKKTLFKFPFEDNKIYPVPALQAKVPHLFRTMVSNPNTNPPFGNNLMISNQNDINDNIDDEYQNHQHHSHGINNKLNFVPPSRKLQLQTSDPRFSYFEDFSDDNYVGGGGGGVTLSPIPYRPTPTVRPSPSKAVSNIQNFFAHLINFMSPEDRRKLQNDLKHAQFKLLPMIKTQNKRSNNVQIEGSIKASDKTDRKRAEAAKVGGMITKIIEKLGRRQFFASSLAMETIVLRDS